MPVDFKPMFSPDRVVDLQGEEKEEVLRELVDVLATSERVQNEGELLEKILEREKTLSTGVGVGLALPHVKIPSITDFVIGIGRSISGVDFQSIDGKPAHIFVMIGCNERQSGEYLKVLSKLVRCLKDRSFQDRIMNAPTKQDVINLFIGPGGALNE